jgi:hypothetical protein
VCCRAKIENMKFLVTDLGDDNIILRYPWLSTFQPKINWKEAVLSEDMQPLIIKTLGLKIDDEVQKIKQAWIWKAQSMATPGEEIFVIQYDEKKIRQMSASAELAIKALPMEEKTWEQIILEHYHQWKKVFSEEEAKRFPEHQPWTLPSILQQMHQKYWAAKYIPFP